MRMRHTTHTTESSSSRHCVRRRLAASIAVAAVFAGAAQVGAAPVEKGTYHDVGSEVLEDLCGDLDVLHSWDVSGSYLGAVRGVDGLVHFRDSSRGIDTFTNPDTGRSYTQAWTSNNQDMRVTDNGDGTLTILIQGSGGSRWYDGDGKLVLRDPGLVRFEILVDDGGTPSDPFDDEFIEYLGEVKGSTGRNDTEGRDFCEDLLLFTA